MKKLFIIFAISLLVISFSEKEIIIPEMDQEFVVKRPEYEISTELKDMINERFKNREFTTVRKMKEMISKSSMSLSSIEVNDLNPPVVQAIHIVFQEGFESGDLNGWTVIDLSSSETGTISNHFSIVDDNGIKRLWLGEHGDYPLSPGYGNYWSQRMLIPIDLTEVTGNCTLSFMLNYDIFGDDALYSDILDENMNYLASVSPPPGKTLNWLNRDFDLTGYIGQKIYVQFRFGSGEYNSDEDGSYNSEGVCLLDEIKVYDDNGVIYYNDYETGFIDEIFNPAYPNLISVSDTTPISGAYSAGVFFGGTQRPGLNQVLISPEIDMSSFEVGEPTVLSFSSFANVYNSDRGYGAVEVKRTTDTDWTMIGHYYPGGAHFFDIPEFSGSVFQIRFRFYSNGMDNPPNYYFTIDEMMIRVEDDPSPPEFVGVSAISGSNTMVYVLWDEAPESDVTQYNIFRSTQTGGPYISVNSTPDLFYVDSGLIPGDTYYYVIQSQDNDGFLSVYSDEARVILQIETGIRGVLIKDTVWSGVTLLTGDIYIPQDIRLTVSPGTIILTSATVNENDVNGNALIDIIVHGGITFNGFPGDIINILSQGGSFTLGGVHVLDEANLPFQLNHFRISTADMALIAESAPTDSIVSNGEFQFNRVGLGILCDFDNFHGDFTFADNFFIDLAFVNGGSFTNANTEISSNSWVSIYMDEIKNGEFSNITISPVTSDANLGIFVQSNSDIEFNDININNKGAAMYFETSNIIASNISVNSCTVAMMSQINNLELNDIYFRNNNTGLFTNNSKVDLLGLNAEYNTSTLSISNRSVFKMYDSVLSNNFFPDVADGSIYEVYNSTFVNNHHTLINSSRFLLDNVLYKQYSENNIQIGGASFGQIKNSVFENNNNSFNCLIDNNSNPTTESIIFENTIFKDFSSIALFIGSSNINVDITNCDFANGVVRGVYGTDLLGEIGIYNCNFADISSIGLQLSNSGKRADITANTFSGTIHVGVHLSNVDYATINNSTFKDTINFAIDLINSFCDIINNDMNISGQGIRQNGGDCNYFDNTLITGSAGIFFENFANADLGNRVNPGPDQRRNGNNDLSYYVSSTPYAIYNNTPNDMYAQGNIWYDTICANIKSTIYDHWDNSALGEIIFNSPPQINDLTINDAGALMNVISKNPRFEWNYSDFEGHSQKGFIFELSDNDFVGVLFAETVMSADHYYIYTSTGTVLNEGQHYQARITAFDSCDYEGDLSQVDFRMNTPPDTPVLISPIGDAITETQTMLVSANDPEGDTLSYRFLIYFEDLDDSPPIPIYLLQDSGWISKNIFMFNYGQQQENLLKENKRHSWKVLVTDGYSDPVGSDTDTFWVNLIQEAPLPVQIISPIPYASSDTTMLAFNWEYTTDPDPGDTVTTYIIKIVGVVNDTRVETRDLGIANTFEIELWDNSVYHWVVMAKDTTTMISSSNTIMFTINMFNIPPSTFSLLEPLDGSVLNTLTPTLSWGASSDTDPFDIVSYEVELLPWGKEGSKIVLSAGTNTSLEIPAGNIKNFVDYSWRVVAYDLADSRTYSNETWEFRTSAYNQDYSEFKIYPNPVRNDSKINFVGLTAVNDIKVYGIDGKLLFEAINWDEPEYSFNINDKKLASGVYICVVSNEKEKKIVKFSVVR